MLKSLLRCHSTTARVITKNTSKTFSKDIIIRNIDESQHTPLVVIVGWANSQYKQLAKYSELYEKQGFTTVSVSNKIYRFAMFYDTLFAEDTKDCIDALDTQRDINKDRNVFFQLFSGPGPCMYLNIMNYYHQYIQGHFGTDIYQNGDKNDVANIRGVVFDSPTADSGSASQFANAMIGSSRNVMKYVILRLIGEMIHSYAVKNSKMHHHGGEFLRNVPVSIPQLVLFSRADRVAGYKAVLDYIDHQRIGGRDVEYKMWGDSSHVAHYRQHPDEYSQLVIDFLQQCLAEESGDQEAELNRCTKNVST